MYYTRTKNNMDDELTVEVYADYGSLVADRRFFNRSDGRFRVCEVKERDLRHRLVYSEWARKPDRIRLMTKDGVRFDRLPDWLKEHIRAEYKPFCEWSEVSFEEAWEYARIA